MILSDGEIRLMLSMKNLEIRNLEPNQIQPASVDITLGNSFTRDKCMDGIPLELDQKIEYETIITSHYVLNPHDFVLATTREYFKLPKNLSAFVEGRSSIGRTGLCVQNAGWVDPGFEGEITLELYNSSNRPIVLREGQRLGQLVFARMMKNAMNPYNGKYQKQTGATGSRIYLDYNT